MCLCVYMRIHTHTHTYLYPSILRKWKHTILFCIWISSPDDCSIESASLFFSYHCTLIPLYYSLFHQFPINGRLSCLQSLAVKNSPTKTNVLHRSFCIFAGIYGSQKSEFARSKGVVILLDITNSPL